MHQKINTEKNHQIYTFGKVVFRIIQVLVLWHNEAK